jgi:hypothetical protein
VLASTTNKVTTRQGERQQAATKFAINDVSIPGLFARLARSAGACSSAYQIVNQTNSFAE